MPLPKMDRREPAPGSAVLRAGAEAVIASTIAPPADVPCAIGVLDDISRMWRYARDHGMADEIKALHRPVIWRALAAYASDWIVIFTAFAGALVWPAAIPLAIIVVGNRQRALGNLLHDAAHGSFGSNRRNLDRLALWLLFRPLWNSLEIYRRDHFAHHRFLGAPGHDVDLIHSDLDMGQPWHRLLWRHLAQRQSWASSAFGHLPRASRGELGMMLAWWVGLLTAIALPAGPLAALAFAGLWLTARVTVFHLITIFREISDHVGLKPGTLIGFSRNQVGHGLLTILIHPHNNGYHLAHHLNPGIPFYALPRAHTLLLAWPDYAAATHGRRYFRGDAALVRSWVRQGRQGTLDSTA